MSTNFAVAGAFALLLAGLANAGDSTSQPIRGGGAHFSWVVFEALESELEQKTGRELTLFGRKSMLGAGCKAGIDVAKESRPGHETFGLVCCDTKKEILEKEGLVQHPIANEPILILVNKSNPVNDLSVDQVRGLFSGKIRNWKQVGGPDKPVAVITRLHCKHNPGHWKTILPGEEHFSKDRVNVKSAAEMVARVTDFANAIGHTGSTWDFGSDSRVKAVKIGGIEASTENMKKKRYPFFRQLGVVTVKQPGKDVMQIIHEVQAGESFRKLARQYSLQPLH
ncbi:MAG: substrate-binding domain-containing protein [Gammaproteobacteria bacterium]|nr:substrate-binding domain-containing protein [Gammaproteobacteria bacterium]